MLGGSPSLWWNVRQLAAERLPGANSSTRSSAAPTRGRGRAGDLFCQSCCGVSRQVYDDWLAHRKREASGVLPEGEAHRMRRNLVVVAVALGLTAMVTACASPPKAEIDAAATAMTQASSAGASEYAPDALKAAQDAQAALDTEVKAQEGKWFPSYARTTELAAAAKTAAEKAVADAAAGKEKAKAEATTAIEEAKTLQTEAQGLLEKAPKGKGSAADIEAMKTDLTNAATSITDAETALAGERYLDARAKAEAAKTAASNVKTAVETAMAAKGKR
jgi:hypothetical protein